MPIARLTLLSILCTALLMSCEAPVTSENTPPAQQEPSKSIELSKEELNNKRKAALRIKEEESKLTSNYKYIISASDLTIFADLLKRSSYGKTAHNEATTIFAPSNKAFNSNKPLTNSLMTGSKEDIDQFVGAHIVKSDSNFKEFFEDGKVQPIKGKEIRMSGGEEITINGKKADGNYISTATGTVYYLEILSIN